MPVASHKEIASILQILKRATREHKRALNPIEDVCFLLDEWIQREYRSTKELPNDLFFGLYYDDGRHSGRSEPSKDVAYLQKLCEKAKKILQTNYHECKPLRELLDKLDRAAKWIGKWPAEKKEQTNKRVDKHVSPGSLVVLKKGNIKGILISHEAFSGLTVCYTDRGTVTVSRDQLTVPRHQQGLKDFKPMRICLPYGLAKLEDGSEILFNRDYVTLWKKRINGEVNATTPQHLKDQGERVFFFNDGTAPWHGNKDTVARCMKALQQWEVDQKPPALLDLLEEAVNAGDAALLAIKD